MRWLWVDRFEEFVSGKYAVSIKNCSLSEEPVDEYCPGYPYFTSSLMVEGLAQTGGLLYHQLSDFKERIVLAKVGYSRFHAEAIPGDTLRYRTDFTSVSDTGAIVECTVHVGDRLLAEAELMFAKLVDDRFENVVLFEPAEFSRMMRLMKLFDVGRYEDGTRIPVPDHLLAAERAILVDHGDG